MESFFLHVSRSNPCYSSRTLSHEAAEDTGGWVRLTLAALALARGESGMVWPTIVNIFICIFHLLPSLGGRPRSALTAALQGWLDLHLPGSVHRPTALLWYIVSNARRGRSCKVLQRNKHPVMTGDFQSDWVCDHTARNTGTLHCFILWLTVKCSRCWCLACVTFSGAYICTEPLTILEVGFTLK